MNRMTNIFCVVAGSCSQRRCSAIAMFGAIVNVVICVWMSIVHLLMFVVVNFGQVSECLLLTGSVFHVWEYF